MASESSVTEMGNKYGGSGPETSTHAQATAASAAERCAANFAPSCLLVASESRATEMDSEYGVSEPEPITHSQLRGRFRCYVLILFVYPLRVYISYVFLSLSLFIFIYISD